MATHPILVLAATGGQGRAVSTALLDRGAPVRALVRNPTSAGARSLADRGADIVTGSLDDGESLAAAMRDVAAVFAMTTPFEGGVEEEITQSRTIVAAAGRARVPHLVFSSVAGADQHSGVPHFESKAVIEAELTSSGLAHTILGPTYFFDNALGGADRIRTEGVLDLPLPRDRPLQQLDRRDLGAFAAHVLLSPERFAGERIELASDAPTPDTMAAAPATGSTSSGCIPGSRTWGGRRSRIGPVARSARRDSSGGPDHREQWSYATAGFLDRDRRRTPPPAPRCRGGAPDR